MEAFCECAEAFFRLFLLHPKMGYRQDKEWEGGTVLLFFRGLSPPPPEAPLLSPKEEEEEEEEGAKHVVGTLGWGC